MRWLIPLLLLLPGCGIHLEMARGTWGTTDFIEAANASKSQQNFEGLAPKTRTPFMGTLTGYGINPDEETE